MVHSYFDMLADKKSVNLILIC